ncbi:hypothetical protein ODV13_04730 [Lactobacillus amylovorus]|uniref:Uncharacterized protein n=1 Tax=Lactobacillus amylovorus TaxID=1604 RepID=A0A9X4ABW3_LACAM|nr:hypothetical protein [Lactobacillus amylovorus]MDB6254114.1 hypothetical protein [Lactobacillus amylovorus]MDB6258286.1 hypothetical protein [Lactobacillus amylovorus]MDB6261349.1 hypothetical protein [Lactobacillus amylovorus]
MTVVLRDAMTFLSKDIDPIVGAISYEKPLSADTPVTIKTDSKTVTVAAKQIKLSMFKLDNKLFGFIFKSTLYHSGDSKEDFSKWNQGTKQMLGRELKPGFLEVRP